MAQFLHYTPGQGGYTGAGYTVAAAPKPEQAEDAGSKIIQTAVKYGMDALRIVARDHDRYQNCRIDDLVQQTDKRFEEWKADWTQKNQGADATEAQKVFAAKYEEFSKEALEQYDAPHTSIYPHQLEKKLMARGLMAFKEGGQYQQQQTRLWEKSVWEGKLAAFEQDCAKYADDPERLEYKRAELVEYFQKQNPGMDVSAVDLQTRQKMAETAFNSFVAGGNLDGAQDILDKAQGGFGKANRASGSAPNTGKTIAEDLHNPLNLKKVGHNGGAREDFEYFASDADGFRGAANQLRLYKTRYGKKTPREMVQRWAPTSDNNNHKKYFQNMAAAGFKNLDAEIDVNDPQQMAMLIKGMATAECGPLARKYSVDQIAGFLTENGGKAQKAAGPARAQDSILDPAKTMQMQSKLDTAKKQLTKQQNQQAVNSFMAQTADLPLRERLEHAQTIFGANREIYDAVQKGIMADDAARERIRKANERDWLKSAYGMLEEVAKLPDEQSWQATQVIISKAPLEKREALYKAANNLRNPAAKDDPIAIDELTERLNQGEDVNIAAEYGNRITRKTAQKLTDKIFRERLPEIRNAFQDAALKWLGDETNKKHAKEYGYGSQTALWAHFLASTDADEKKDLRRLREEAEDFFKSVILNPGWFKFNVDTIQGLQRNVLDKYENAWPESGTDARMKAQEYLREKFPKRVSFSNEEYAKAYRAKIGYPLKGNN